MRCSIEGRSEFGNKGKQSLLHLLASSRPRFEVAIVRGILSANARSAVSLDVRDKVLEAPSRQLQVVA